jgi:phosphorylase kinase gamma subunit
LISLLRLVSGHPNIIDLIEYFESPTYIFLVFELCQQGELFDYLSQNVRLSEKKCRMLMRQVFSAVHHCHQVLAHFLGQGLLAE